MKSTEIESGKDGKVWRQFEATPSVTDIWLALWRREQDLALGDGTSRLSYRQIGKHNREIWTEDEGVKIL